MRVSVKGDVTCVKASLRKSWFLQKVVGVKNILKDSIKECLCKSCEDDEDELTSKEIICAEAIYSSS